MKNQEKFTTQSGKLKVQRANIQAISYPFRFFTSSLFSSLVSFAFLSCFFLFNDNYIFWYTFNHTGRWVTKIFTWPITKRKVSFFGLNWKIQTYDIITKLNKANALLCKIRNYVRFDNLKADYFAIFDSHINYANFMWWQDPTSKSGIIKEKSFENYK